MVLFLAKAQRKTRLFSMGYSLWLFLYGCFSQRRQERQGKQKIRITSFCFAVRPRAGAHGRGAPLRETAVIIFALRLCERLLFSRQGAKDAKENKS